MLASIWAISCNSWVSDDLPTVRRLNVVPSQLRIQSPRIHLSRHKVLNFRAIRVSSLLWLHQVIRAGRAFFEMLQQGGTCHVLPVLRLGEQLPAFVRMIRGTLSAERSHCAHAAHPFHSHPPVFFPTYF